MLGQNPPLSAMSTYFFQYHWKILKAHDLAVFVSSATVSPVSVFPSNRNFFRAKFELNGAAQRFAS